MNTKQEEFIESLKALMTRYSVEIVTDRDDNDVINYYFVSKENKIDVYIGDIE